MSDLRQQCWTVYRLDFDEAFVVHKNGRIYIVKRGDRLPAMEIVALSVSAESPEEAVDKAGLPWEV